MSDCNWTWTDNHLDWKKIINHLVKLASLAKWLSVRFQTKWLWIESSSSHLNFRFCTCFEQGVTWHSDNYRVWIHSEMHTWQDNNIVICPGADCYFQVCQEITSLKLGGFYWAIYKVYQRKHKCKHKWHATLKCKRMQRNFMEPEDKCWQ